MYTLLFVAFDRTAEEVELRNDCAVAVPLKFAPPPKAASHVLFDVEIEMGSSRMNAIRSQMSVNSLLVSFIHKECD